MSNWVTVRPSRAFRQTSPLWTNRAFNDPFFNEAFSWVFGTPQTGKAEQSEATYSFPLNVAKDENNYYVYAVLPGASLEKLEITALENKLTIAGEIEGAGFELPQSETEQPKLKWLRRELPEKALRFHRVLELPTSISADDVKASYDNGILRLVVPQAPEARARRIAVTTPKAVTE
ncbi:MAG TPA: Hsp20/alpha crystallin family protein [Chloroflexia bacterium]|nr:Hsp20/alpha crystallin family protein [Chloroflexia bacterium]